MTSTSQTYLCFWAASATYGTSVSQARGFRGAYPRSSVRNLSRLQYLDLSFDSLKVSDLSWLRHPSSLESLDMGAVDLSLAGDWDLG